MHIANVISDTKINNELNLTLYSNSYTNKVPSHFIMVNHTNNGLKVNKALNINKAELCILRF